MMELPEAVVMTEQINATLKGKKIARVTANHSPHKFAWFFGDPEIYDDLLAGETVEQAAPYGGMVEITAGGAKIVFSEGINLRYFAAGEKLPAKHQLHLEFTGGSSLIGSVQMYGGLWAFPDGAFTNPYYAVAREKPSPLTEEFDYPYFKTLLMGEKVPSLPAKAFLATGQRIPGLGNGALQDILWRARIHPKRKMATLSQEELHILFSAVKSVLVEMVAGGGRDTERDLYGHPGGYQTILSKKTVGGPCPACGTAIQKAAYLGGSIYFCPECQKLR